MSDNRFWGDLEAPWPPHAENLNIPIGILRFWSLPQPPWPLPNGSKLEKSHWILKIVKSSWNFMKFHETSWKFMKSHEVSLFLTYLMEKGDSKTLIFVRENYDLGADPPKDRFSANFTAKSRNSSKNCNFCRKIKENRLQSVKTGFWGIWSSPGRPMLETLIFL